ncbi:MAG: presqualene diphosphate synthase HpnD [Hydrogenophilaceae bacterium]|nr:presqualene diphosphate synthase HpnD [Hydrogenophilaceae bacterium]
MDPRQYCREKAAASGSSFYYSFRVLKPEKRDAITAFYALCRELDDVVDECSDTSVARIKLAWWRNEINNLYQGIPQHPVTRALYASPTFHEISRAWLDEIVEGMEMDLDLHRYPDYKTLLLYCHRAAGVVGQAAAAIFGYRNHLTLKYAHELGLAFQLTNIIRDVGEDAILGRIYLPLEELDQFGVGANEILRRQHSDRFESLMQFQYERANQAYDRALAWLPAEDRNSQRAGLAMAAIYRALLEEIRRSDFRVLDQKISLPPVRKLWLAWKTATFA